MKKIFKWLFYTIVSLLFIISVILFVAYRNRDRILETVIEQLNKGINGKFTVEKLDFTFFHHFPNLSVTLHNVDLRGEKYDTYKKDIFAANKIFMDLKLWPFLKKEIQVKSLTLDDASIFIFRASNGYTNADIFKSAPDSSRTKSTKGESSMLLSIQQIGFKNVQVTYADSVKGKYMSFTFLKTNQTLIQTDSVFQLGIAGPMQFGRLSFNSDAGSFLVDKNTDVNLHAVLNTKTKTLSIEPSSLTFQKSVVNLNGEFELPKGGRYSLNFEANDLDLAEAKTLLNERLVKTLRRFNLDKPVNVTVSLTGTSVPGNQPDVDVTFASDKTNFQYGKLHFTDLAFNGSFTNHIDSTKFNDNDNSEVNIKTFSGKLEKTPVQGRVSFTQLKDPVADIDVTSKLNFVDLNEQIDTSRFVFKKGTFATEIKYKGKLTEYLDHTLTHYDGKLNGHLVAKDASVYYGAKHMTLDNINTTCDFNENKFTINELGVDVNGSPLKMKGSMENFIPFFIRPKNKGYVKLSLNAPALDLTALASKTKKADRAQSQIQQQRKKMTDLFDVVYHNLEFDLDVNIGKLTFKKFKATAFVGKVKLDNAILEAKPIKMDIAGGTMNVSFIMSELFNEVSPLAIEGVVSDANIKEFFLCFNNFNQNTVHADNLSGNISADVKFSAQVDGDYMIIPSSMLGSLDCKITNGGLKDFDPLQNMSNFLFKKRDFTDVQFAELNSYFLVVGTSMDISRMEIQSTVLSLYLQGRYSFTDSTSLSVQIPLSNLRKRNKDFKPENLGTDAKVGPSVFLHVYRNRDINSKINIAYDPFKKWVRN